MKSRRFVYSIAIVICISILPVIPAHAGNKWMMKKMEQNLIKLNNEVIRQIGAVEDNSRVSLKARIIQGPGDDNHLIVIESLEITPGTDETSGEIQETSPSDYETYISYQSMDIPDTAGPWETGAPDSHGSALPDDMSRYLDDLKKEHPGAKIVPLHPDTIDRIDWKDSDKKPKKAFLLFW